MYSTSNIHLDGCTAEHLSSFPLDFVSTNVDTSHASVTSRNDQINIGTSDYYCRVKTGPGLTDCPPVLLKSTRDGPSKGRSSLANSSLGHQAKRARVENIIRGMISSPGMCDTSVTTYPYEPAGHVREYGKTQDLPSHQEHIESSRSVSKNHSQTRKQPESQQQPLRQLRTKVDHEERESCNYSKKETYSSWSASIGNPTEDSFTDWSEFDSQKYQCWKKLKLMNYFQSRPERVKLLADVLKYELSRAVNRSVDCVFKNVPLLQTSTITECIQTDKPVCRDKITRLSCCRNAKVQVPGIQTEALSLVVEKQRLETSSHLLMQPRSAAEQSKPLKRSSLDSTLTTNQLSEKSPDTNQPLRCSEDAPAKCDTLDALWTSVKVKSKVNSKHVSIPQNCTMSEDAEPPGSLCLPRIKIESESLKTNLYLLNEGLTTNHLKKAKLMFFYTRYPSSLVLRMCFPDVQFTRCITSQLIKWFSNFREFFYIQIEKFARHALVEGAADVRDLTVGRESQLFRALNMHYNKANDFQVPERFLEVTEITLREFYFAISTGKDQDPSWKKAIYKVICKLDGQLPAGFNRDHRK